MIAVCCDHGGLSLKQEVRSLNKPSFYAGTAPAGAVFCGCTPAGHKRPQAFLGVRSAGRVRPSDHPRD